MGGQGGRSFQVNSSERFRAGEFALHVRAARAKQTQAALWPARFGKPAADLLWPSALTTFPAETRPAETRLPTGTRSTGPLTRALHKHLSRLTHAPSKRAGARPTHEETVSHRCRKK